MKTFGQVAYETYCDHRRWVSVRNERLPEWNEVLPEIREAWIAAALNVIEESDRRRDDE
jgi:hypothetical protein